MRTLRRRPIATAAAVAAAALTLGGCTDTNFSSQSNQPYQAAVGANHRGDIDVLNTLLVANPDGSATVSAGIVNHNDAEGTLTGLTATVLTADGTLQVSGPDEAPALPSQVLVPVGREGGSAVYTVDEAPIGKYVELIFTFGDSTTATVEAPVVTRGEMYENIAISTD